MAAPDLDEGIEPLVLTKRPSSPVQRWTAQLALELLPETNGPKVEVFGGSVIVSSAGV